MSQFLVCYGVAPNNQNSPAESDREGPAETIQKDVPETIWQFDEKERRNHFGSLSLQQEFDLLFKMNEGTLGKTAETLANFSHLAYLIPQLFARAELLGQPKSTLGMPMFLTACKQGNVACIEELLDCGVPADIQEPAEERYTALMHAIENGHTAVVRTIMTHPRTASMRVHLLSQKNSTGETPLMVACSKRHIEHELNIIHHRNNEAQSQQLLTAYRECADLLLNEGASIDEVDNDGHNAFMHAVFSLHLPMVELLRDHPCHKGRDLVNEPCVGGYRPIMLAIIAKDMDAFSLLFDDLQAEVIVSQNKTKRVLYAVYSYSHHLPSGQTVRDSRGYNLYMLAALHNNVAAMNKLIRAGIAQIESDNQHLNEANYDDSYKMHRMKDEFVTGLQNRHGNQTALHLICEHGHTQAANAFIDHCMIDKKDTHFDSDQVRAINIQGFTPLSLAAYNGHADVIEALLGRIFMNNSYYAKSDIKNVVNYPYSAYSYNHSWRKSHYGNVSQQKPQHQDNMALHYAAERGHTDVARILLQYGAKKKLTNAMGKTASDVAHDAGHEALAQMLKP